LGQRAEAKSQLGTAFGPVFLVKEHKMLRKKSFVAVMFFLILLAGSALAGGDPARGKELAADCSACHGDDGKGDDEIPAIAGQDAATLVVFLKAFKSGERASEDDVMQEYTADLTDEEMADVAAYFASLPAN